MPELQHRIRAATAAWRPTEVALGTLAQARDVLADARSAVVLTGAGLSTDSGIPDYRGPGAQRATPMLYSEFLHDDAARRRYWARSFIGFARMTVSSPNEGHRMLAAWEWTGRPCRLEGLITQNVDGLHEAAGSRRVVNLHGRIDDVVCLQCGTVSSRTELQRRLAELNPEIDPLGPMSGEHPELRPDGDAVVERWEDFVVAPCGVCGGMLKPDVVFFGESAPREKVATAMGWVEAADALLVAGSSLTVMSGLRFVRQAARLGKPVVIVNRGATRGDELATVRLDAGTSETLAALLQG